MSVTVNQTRKAVEIAWDPSGINGGSPSNPPDGFPEYPVDPDYGISVEHPDHTLPGDLPSIWPDPPEGQAPHPEHPIYLPPYIDNSLPESGLTDEQKAKLKAFLFGNLPPYPHPEPTGGINKSCQVFAQGMEGDWSNTAVMPNDGYAVLTYPQRASGRPLGPPHGGKRWW